MNRKNGKYFLIYLLLFIIIIIIYKFQYFVLKKF